jgi:hypothetical protein
VQLSLLEGGVIGKIRMINHEEREQELKMLIKLAQDDISQVYYVLTFKSS